MKSSWRSELPMLVSIATMFGIAAWSMNTLPETVPLHWNARGEADGFGRRAVGAWFTPVLAAALYVLLLFIPRLDPARAAASGFDAAYRIIRLGVVGFMLAMYVVIQAAMHGVSFSMTRVVLPLVGGLFFVLGYAVGRLRMNSSAGVPVPRVPGIGGNDPVLARKVLIADGVLFVVAGLIARDWALWAAIGGVLIGAMWLVIHDARAESAHRAL